MRISNRTARALRLAIFRISENQIDIGGEVELTAAEFAHSDDQHGLRFPLRITRRAHFQTAALIEPLIAFKDQRFRQLGKVRKALF
ncbi:hypothetical protein DN30_3617 [Vibrio cholerae]|nr:hypothetical protein DN30_3617 [Vibrio cholerae]